MTRMSDTPHDPSAVFLVAARDAARLAALLAADESIARSFASTAARLAGVINAGGKILVCGNGGSMCDAMHFAEELTGRFRRDRPALPAIAISDPSHLTCVANDYGFDQVFSRAVEALGRPGDALVAISTSGNSPNIVRAVDAARARGITTIALLGKHGGKLRESCDERFIVPGATTDRIQELHMIILHAMVEAVERELFGVP
jgi:D-sedoheptulose 7-phosphate isomerase